MPSKVRSAGRTATARKESKDFREAILQTAVTEFSAKGFSGARVDVIAERAQANKQLIYYYFGNKVGLYEAVLDRMIAHTAERLDSHGPHDSIVAAVTTHLDNLLGGGDEWIRFWLWEALEPVPSDAERERDRARAWHRWVDEFGRAQKRGEINARFDPKMLALTMNSIVVTPYMTPTVTKLITGLDPSSPTFLKRQLTVLTEFLRSIAK
jgi:AcrR family transcriptional regulator